MLGERPLTRDFVLDIDEANPLVVTACTLQFAGVGAIRRHCAAAISAAFGAVLKL